jgi:hypothetical protein
MLEEVFIRPFLISASWYDPEGSSWVVYAERKFFFKGIGEDGEPHFSIEVGKVGYYNTDTKQFEPADYGQIYFNTLKEAVDWIKTNHGFPFMMKKAENPTVEINDEDDIIIAMLK